MNSPAAMSASSSPAPVQLCFGAVHHSRLRPVAHRFNYGVYFMRIPLRTLGADNFNSRLLSRNRFNLLSFHDRDHGDGKSDPLHWIDALLRTHEIDDATGEIWLQCFPRVLGYVFNPVSFWFCHRTDGALRAIVCEVRNTFGERHCYLLDNGGVMAWGEELSARKLFHVSPFCAVEGQYRFRFVQHGGLHAHAIRTLAAIDHDDEQGLLLRTSLSGRSQELSDRAVLRAFFTYPLMTLGVIVRIHWQALRLWCKRVPFFSKPTPPADQVSR